MTEINGSIDLHNKNDTSLTNGLPKDHDLTKQESLDNTATNGPNHLANMKSKFERGDSTENPSANKRKEKVYYAGLESAKNKFIDEANKDAKVPQKDNKPKRVTPPRDGVFGGILENKPAERDPNVVSCMTQIEEQLPTPLMTRTLKAKFKEMEQNPNVIGSIDHKTSVDLDPEAAKATKGILSKWKEIEKNPDEFGKDLTPKKPQIKLYNDIEEEEGGVFENDPKLLDNVVRSTDSQSEDVVERISTKERRENFLRNSCGTTPARKLTPQEEIEEFTKRTASTVFENTPSGSREGVVKHDDITPGYEPVIYSTREVRQLFAEVKIEEPHKPKQPITLPEGEAGIYESNPIQLENVVRYNTPLETNGVTTQNNSKWATEAKMRFMEEVAKSSTKKAKEPMTLEFGEGGVFENQPTVLENVIRSTDTLNYYPAVHDSVSASEAKKLWLQKQQEELSNVSNKVKEPPKIIDIWSELTSYCGVFENTPAPRDPKIMRAYNDIDDEEENYVRETEHDKDTKAKELNGQI